MEEVMMTTLATCAERFRANGITLMLPKVATDLKVSCREVQIEQILLNLLENAFDAVVEQSGERWVQLDVSSSDDSVVLSVTDSGPGIPERDRPHIMELFFPPSRSARARDWG
jgi:C4-dicarboxylate-specific signal transduction histidine kinase